MKKSAKILLSILSLVLVVSLSVGGTMAYLQARSDSVTNTFTFGNIQVALEESTGGTYKVIPGVDIGKDPTVIVSNLPGYENVDAFVYVKVEEQNWPTGTTAAGSRKLGYEIADGWTPLSGVPGVYYREVKADASVKSFPVLKDNKVTVSGELTKAELAQHSSAKLIFTAYAVQKDGMSSAKDAWTKAGF